MATFAFAVASSGVLAPGGSHPADAPAKAVVTGTDESHLASVIAKASPSSTSQGAITAAAQVAAPRSAVHAVATGHVVTHAKPTAKPAARPAAATISVWTSGFQAQLNACRGAVDLTGAYRVPTIGEKWTCGGARFPRAGALVRLTGLHAGLYRVGPVVAMLNAYTQNSGAIPHGYALLFQTCVNDNAHTESFTALTRVG